MKSSEKSTLINKNSIGRNGQQLQCHICCSRLARFDRNCPDKLVSKASQTQVA